MASKAFFNSTTGDPTKLQRLLAFQSAFGVPALDAALIPFKGFGGSMTPSPKWIRRQQILSRPMRAVDMASKTDNEGSSFAMGDFDPANHAQLMLMLSYLQGYSLATSAGATRWRISQQQAIDGTELLSKLTYINDTDKGIPIRFVDLMCNGFNIGFQPRSNAAINYNVIAGKHDFWAEDVITGTGVIKMHLRHTFPGNWEDSTTLYDVELTVSAPTATTVDVAVSVGGGADSATQTITKGRWTYLYTGTPASVPLGNRAQQVQVYIPTGIAGNFVAADVHKFESRRVVATVDGDYPIPFPISETQCRFFLGDEEIAVDNGVTITASAPGAVVRYAAGGEQPVGTDRKGQQDISVQLDRRLVDLDLQYLLMTRGQAKLVIEAVGDDEIAASGVYYGATFVFPNLVLEGAMHDAAAGAQNFNETLTLKAGKSDVDVTFPSVAGIAAITDFTADMEVVWDTDLVAADLGL